MRKIISILIVLGLVLAFSAVALPAAAVTCTATVTVTPPCAGTGAVYCVKFAAPVTLVAGNDYLSVKFGAGTTFAAGFTAADITVNGNVTTSVVVTGTQIMFPIPVPVSPGVGIILPGALVTVCISDVINPSVPGSYTLDLNYKLAATPSVVFGCGTYTIGAATRYVVEGGAGAQNGANWSNAFATIQQAIDAACPGDIVTVAAGTYAAFQVIGKNNIHIIGAEGATVATTNLYTALPVIGNAWVLAAVYNSTNINIEGINFDGTGVKGKTVVVGIAYVDSTGRIADLTVKDVTATQNAAGVAIIGYTGTSAVDLTGATVKNSMIGIFVGGAHAILEAHFNSIVGNPLCGACSYEGGTLDATRNWWGDVSGPHHSTANPDGSGDTVSDNVDFKPWLGAADIVIQTVTNKTVDARAKTQTEVAVTGTATVIIAKYASNPHPPTSTLTLESYATGAPADFLPLEIWRDVCLIDTKPGTEIEIQLYYTDDEVAAANVTEESLRLFWHDGNDWVACSDSGVNTANVTVNATPYSGYMWTKVTDTTTPRLAALNGTPWGGYGHPKVVTNCCSASVAAASGTNVAEKLNLLREFRDALLLPDSSGAKFVSLYYRTSPPVAKLMSQHELLRTAVRVCLLEPIVAILGWSHDLWSAESFMSLAAIPLTK